MASAQVDIDNEMKSMVMCFRVSELQVLLGHAGRNKSGRKHELMSRALQLVRSSSCNKAIQSKIIDLYSQRYPHHTSRMKPTFSSPPKTEPVNGRPLSSFDSHKHVHQDMDQVKYPESNIKLKPLPFCERIATILHPVPLSFKPNRPLHFSEFKFKLNPDQSRMIRTGTTESAKRQLQYKVQVQLRFCILDTLSEQEDKLPPNLVVKVNRNPAILPAIIQPNKSGVEARRPNRPIDITSLCRLSSCEDQAIEVRWANEANKPPSKYAVTINLIRQLTVDDLLYKLKQGGVAEPSVSRSLIRKKLAKDPESDIATTSLKVSLLCPLGKMRMKLPTRSSKCTHLQCFDASLFLMMNEKKPTWTCPVCDKRACFNTLAIDGLFMEILNNCTSDEIEFTEDGNWHCAKKKTETLVIGTPMKPIGKRFAAGHAETRESVVSVENVPPNPNSSKLRKLIGGLCSVVTDSIGYRKKPVVRTAGKKISERKSSKVVARLFREKNEDLSQSGCKTPQKEKKSAEPDIIDLTGDSSDEEPLNSPPAKSPAWVSDGTPMSISCSPCHVGSPNLKLNKLDPPPTNYSSGRTKSPHVRGPPKTRMSPSRSPLRQNDSPYYYPHRNFAPYSYHSKSPKSVTHSTPPLGYPPISSHSSPYSLNGVVDVTPSAVPSPLVTSTSPPIASDSLSSMSHLGLGMNGYSPSPLSWVSPLADSRFTSHAHYNDLLQQRYYEHFSSHANFSPLFMQPPFIPQLDLYSRTLQGSAPSSDSRTLAGQQQRLQDADTNFNQDAIPID